MNLLYHAGYITSYGNNEYIEKYLEKLLYDKEKYIKLMVDYEAYPIWDSSYMNMSYDRIPSIRIITIQKLEACRLYFDNVMYDDYSDMVMYSLMVDAFENLIHDLPDYTIHLFG